MAENVGQTDSAGSMKAVSPARRSGYVFISYKSEEAALAEEVQRYVEKAGYPCWRAPGSLHITGTQDYNSEILEAIRGARCLLFLLSNKALGGHWVRREVRYAMDKCGIPVIPYTVSLVSRAKKDTDSVYASLLLEKQILNEDLSNDMSVILPYVEQAFSGEGQKKGDVLALGNGKIEKVECSAGHYALCRDRADYYIERIAQFSGSKVREEARRMTPAICRRELRKAVRDALHNLIDLLILTPSGDAVAAFDLDGSREKAEADLSKIVYENEKTIEDDVYDRVEPYAEDGITWANFVLYPKFLYPRDTRGENYTAQAFKALERSVADGRNPYAMIRFGECYMWGIGCEISATRAMFWIQRAEALGCPYAYAVKARLYESCRPGIAQDAAKFVQCLEQGVEAGDPEAMWRLGSYHMVESYRERMGGQNEDKILEHRRKGEDLFLQSYESGSMRGLGKFVELKLWEVGYATKEHGDRAKKDQQSLEDLGDSHWKSMYADFQMRKSEDPREDGRLDTAADYAVAGLDGRVPDCPMTLAKIVMRLVDAEIKRDCCEESETRLRMDPSALVGFLDMELRSVKSERARYIKRAMKNYRLPDDGKPCHYDLLDYFQSETGQDCYPRSAFWEKLCSTGTNSGEMPSDIGLLCQYTPARFFHALKAYGGEPDSRLGLVIRLWNLLRTIDVERSDAMSVSQQQFAFVMPGVDVSPGERIKKVLAVMGTVMVSLPENREEYESLVRKAEFENADEAVQGATDGMSGADARLVELIDGFGSMLVTYAKEHPHSLLRYAKMLNDEQYRISHPRLEVALNYARLAYSWGFGTSAANLYGYLFLASNARYRDPDRNETTLFRVCDALVKSVYMGSFKALPLLFESCLFGLDVDGANVKPDFALLLKLADCVQIEVARRSEYQRTAEERRVDELVLPDEKVEAARVAYAFGKVFMDKNLHLFGKIEDGSAAFSLYYMDRASDWMAYAHRCANDIEMQGAIPKAADEVLKELVAKGYMVDEDKADIRRTLFLGAENDDAGPEGEAMPVESDGASSEDGRKQQLVELAERFGALNEALTGFPHVYLEPWMCDIAVSNDEEALIFDVLPSDVDYEVDAASNGPDEPHRVEDCVVDGTLVAKAVFAQLAGFCGKLQEMEPESTLRPAILASARTVRNLTAACRAELESRNLLVCSYEDVEENILDFFRLPAETT